MFKEETQPQQPRFHELGLVFIVDDATYRLNTATACNTCGYGYQVDYALLRPTCPLLIESELKGRFTGEFAALPQNESVGRFATPINE